MRKPKKLRSIRFGQDADKWMEGNLDEGERSEFVNKAVNNAIDLLKKTQEEKGLLGSTPRMSKLIEEYLK